MRGSTLDRMNQNSGYTLTDVGPKIRVEHQGTMGSTIEPYNIGAQTMNDLNDHINETSGGLPQLNDIRMNTSAFSIGTMGLTTTNFGCESSRTRTADISVMNEEKSAMLRQTFTSTSPFGGASKLNDSRLRALSALSGGYFESGTGVGNQQEEERLTRRIKKIY